MSPVNHMLTGWLVANSRQRFGTRDRIAITLGCLVPDLDGLGIVADILTVGSNNPLTWWTDFHHVLGHNLLFGLVFSIGVYLLSNRNFLVAILSFLTFHLHLIEDFLIGRHGEGHVWTIQYMYPFNHVEWGWNGQLELNAWPNFVVVVIFLGIAFYLAWNRGYSPLEMISKRADQAFISTLRARFGAPDAEK